jgi:thiamine pyrophosphate-dependent acetolactate synthase large subunit-like protein
VSATAHRAHHEPAFAPEPTEPQTITGGHLVAKALRAEGIDTIFTLCGGHIIDIYDRFAQMLGGYGEEVREPGQIRPALERAGESGRPALINVWIDPDAFAPGTMNQTMYKSDGGRS